MIDRTTDRRWLLAAHYVMSGEGLALIDTRLFADAIQAVWLVQPFDVTLDDDYGHYLITHPERLSDTAMRCFAPGSSRGPARRPRP